MSDWPACRRARLRLVIFDCDGVLVDSEAIASRVVAADLTARGWAMDADRAAQLFTGMTITDMEPMVAARLGPAMIPSWRVALVTRIMAAMGAEAALVDGALEALNEADALGLVWRVASNSSHEELRAKFARTGLRARTDGRVHSHLDVARGKPAPDLFLAAAAAQGVSAAECVVIEDSVPGASAAHAAGMDCLGYAPHHDGAALRRLGAHVFTSMHEIPGLLRAALQVDA